jgi:hypothetical protein
MSENWYANHDVGNKLKQTLEGAIVGQGLHVIFKGLEEQGRADIIVVYNGENISFLNNTPTLNTPIIEPLVATESEDTMQYNEEFEPELQAEIEIIEKSEPKPKRKRNYPKTVEEVIENEST